MIHTRDHKTGYILNPWGYLGTKRRKLLDESWAGLFREHILNELPVEKIAPFFHEDIGWPTKEMYTAMGVVILQQAHDLDQRGHSCVFRTKSITDSGLNRSLIPAKSITHSGRIDHPLHADHMFSGSGVNRDFEC